MSWVSVRRRWWLLILLTGTSAALAAELPTGRSMLGWYSTPPKLVKAYDELNNNTALRPRGLVLVCDQGTSVAAYEPLMDAIRTAAGRLYGPKGIFELDIELVIVPYNDGDTEETVVGRAALSMGEYDPQYWAVAGHGRGAPVASLLAKLMNPRVKLLALLDGHPHANVKSSLLDRTLYCIVAMASDDAAASVAQQLQRNAREVVKLQLPPLLGRGDGSELAVPFVRAMASLTYPELLPEAKPYLLSNDEVSVEQGSTGDTGWLAFRPTQRPPVASVLLLQGKAVPAEGYAGLLQRLARLGYVCIVVAAPGRDADYVPQDTIIQIMHAHAEQSTGEWFIAAHSGGGLAATRWARSHLDLVPHKAHSSKDEVPEVQQCSEAAQKTPPSTPPGIRLRGVLLLAATAGGFVKDDERGKHLPFLQLVGTCDGGYHRVPNSAEYYLNKHLAPYVPQSSITVVPIEGGTHGGWAWFGYKDPYLLGWISLEDQQQQGAEAADKWMQQVLGSGDQCASTA